MAHHNNMKGGWWYLQTTFVFIIFNLFLYGSVESSRYAYPYSSNSLGINRKLPN